MLRNYFKVAIRSLLKYKGYTAINIIGLAVGICSCILIMLFVKSDWSYDRFHSKADRIYRVWQHEKYPGQEFVNVVTPLPMAAAIQHSFPEVESTCRVFALNTLVKADQNSFTEDVRIVDSSFFNLFDFELLRGDKKNPFPTVNSVIITPEVAKKYFGNTDPVGKNIEMQLNETNVLFAVSGIIKKAPVESSIKYNMLISSYNDKYIFRPGAMTNWFNVFVETYVLLPKNAVAINLERKFPSMVKQQLGEDYKEGSFVLHLQPLTNIHLNNQLPTGIENTSNPKYTYILGSIGLLVLLVACVNFITLSVGRSTTRALEVGVRKALGAERQQIIRQFWGEAFLLTLISVLVGILLATLFLQPFNNIIGKQLVLQPGLFFYFFCLLLVAVIALIAGIYPAIVLSGFNPVEVLKGKLKMKSNMGWLRQGLITGQFVASIGMIACTIIIGEQMNYLKNKDLGYNKDQIVVVPTNKKSKEAVALAQLFRNELLKHPEVQDVSISLYSFAEPSWVDLGFTDDKKVYHDFEYNSIDPYFIKTMGIQMAKGRDFSTGAADEKSGAIVNEAFLKEFNITDPIGKKLPGKFMQQIIGVVKDFNFESLHTTIKPVLLTINADSIGRWVENVGYVSPPQPRVSVRLKPGSLVTNLNVLKQAWKAVAPNQEFEYSFLDDKIAALYEQEQRTNTIVKVASALAIFIACMGLFGLATLAVMRRTKEIGIRKVLGAGVGNIVLLISKTFIKLILLAAIISFPLAWWFMKDWLKDFAYQVNISWWIFLSATALVLMIALLTVSIQAIKAAMANPVKSLRTE